MSDCLPSKAIRPVRHWLMVLAAALCSVLGAAAAPPTPDEPMLGMYVHQHWSYNHPYCARTWTIEDWHGYLDGLKRLGYNTVLIWPVLETVPEPMTPSDRENLERIAQVIDLAHNEFSMRAYFVLCPNNRGSDKAAEYAFQDRPFFATERRVNPQDPVEMGKLMAFRKELITPLKNADGIFIIDSDPGGWPFSTNLDFVSILRAHRFIMDQVRPEMELVYWAAHGWEAYARFYETGEIKKGTDDEFNETVHLIAENRLEPWWIASMNNPDLTPTLYMQQKILSFNYGAIEWEPSFPVTNFDEKRAAGGGAKVGQLGVLGNSQTHCVQLPAAFQFAAGAQGKTLTREDYVAFAEDLLPGHGELILQGWEALNSVDPAAIQPVIDQLHALAAQPLQGGPLKGLLFGDPQRFVDDLAKQLQMNADIAAMHQAAFAEPRDTARLRSAWETAIASIETWQQKHNYKNNWYHQQLYEALRKIATPAVTETLDKNVFVGEGETMFEKVQDGLRRMETFTPRLIEAMKQDVQTLQ